MADAKKVLDELRGLGAVGPVAKTPPTAVRIEEVEVEQGPPSARLLDRRGLISAELLRDAVRHIDDMTRAMEGLRETLGRLTQVWGGLDLEPEDGEEPEEGPERGLETPETVRSAVRVPEGPSEDRALTRPQSPPAALPPDPSDEQYRAALDAARKKIRGEDAPPPEDDEEDDVPFVGQVRALPPGAEPEEVSLGTVGQVRPSFPVEENDGT